MTPITLTNPLYWTDIPDVDVIRVNDMFYMISTSMHTMPGCPIMKSVNLRDWEIVSYVFDKLEDNQEHYLIEKKGIYGQGSWAASLRYENDTYYVCFSSNDMKKFYIYQTDDIEKGEWKRSEIDGIYHDPALLFDGGRVFVIYGCGDIKIVELTEDVTQLKESGINQILLQTPTDNIGLRCEGCHAYYINGYYYLLFIEWPTNGNERRRQICYRSKSLLGKYERKIIFDDDFGYKNKGIAQGAIFDTQAGDWYAMLFQDHDAVGRIPYILPVQWKDNWPMIGVDGKTPEQIELQLPNAITSPIVISDEFHYTDNVLSLQWQWNHNPMNECWSLTERNDHLRLRTSRVVENVLEAPNTLTQRTEGPTCEARIKIDCTNMQIGDVAGLIALQSNFGTVGIKKMDENHFEIQMTKSKQNQNEVIIDRKEFATPILYLKIRFQYEDSIDQATFYWSDNEVEWNNIGDILQMKYTLDHFMGYRIGIFNYATEVIGGHVDIDYFRYKKIK